MMRKHLCLFVLLTASQRLYLSAFVFLRQSLELTIFASSKIVGLLYQAQQSSTFLLLSVS